MKQVLAMMEVRPLENLQIHHKIKRSQTVGTRLLKAPHLLE
jgi:hypothetical protein